MRYVAFAVAAVVCTAVASVSSAARVDYKLYMDAEGPGTFRLTVQELDGPSDNRGIASFGVQLTGATTVVNQSPFTVDLTTFSQRGFNLLRSSDAASVAVLTGSQDTIGGAGLIYNFGQAAGTWAANGITPGGPTTRPNTSGWAAELLLATGTYPPSGELGFNLQSPDFATNTFALTGSGVSSAVQTTQIIEIPEPATVALAGLGLIGVAALRRRKA